MSGIEPRDEHDLRVWTAIAMWLGGGCAMAVETLVLGRNSPHIDGLIGLVCLSVLVVIFALVVLRRASNQTLYVATNIFTVLGAVVVWFAVYWSGGPRSGFFELYFFPILYAAYFFRARQAIPHLLLNTALALSPLIYSGSLGGTQFPAHAAVLVSGFWGMAAVVGYRKAHLLRAELSSRRQALSDPLTGLHNVRSLRELATRRPPADVAGVLVIDIDDFKAVNTVYGHTGGDDLLRKIGSELLDVAAPGDCVARIGGDEFAILAYDRTPLEIEALAESAAQAVRRAGRSTGREHREVSASVGYSLSPRDGRALDDLLVVADQTMFRHKAEHRRAAIELPAPAPPRKETPPADSEDHDPPAPGWWRERPLRSVAGGATWIGAAAITLLVILLPDADTAHTSLVLLLIAGAVATGVFMLLFAPAIGDSAYATSDVLGVLSIAFGVYLTGGTTSPLLPLVFLQATFAAYFSPPRGALLRLLGVVLVCASPFTYAPDGAQLAFVVRVIAIITTATVLVGIILYNKRELAQAEESSRELASHDPLTGLPNRRSFRRDVIRALRETGAGAGLGLSIAIIDVDNFKRVNDLHGHAAGDELLTRIARALSGVTREADIVARIGGDEFALLAPGADASTAQMLGERCVEATETAVIEAGYAECDVSATVGYALFPQHGATFQELLQAADSALMNAKDRGKHMVASAPARAPALATPRSPVVTHSAPATA